MDTFFRILWINKVAFFATFFAVFTLSYVTLMALDLLPEPPAEEQSDEHGSLVATDESVVGVSLENESIDEEVLMAEDLVAAQVSVESILPVQITINKLGKTIPVLNPVSRTIADLDEALLGGVVRHPDSATLSQEGNIFILGHSSYLPNVFNRNFQAFNGIQNLEWGDIITIQSEDHVYEYRVERVYRARAQDVTVPIAGTGNMLTLATCNSFGSVDDRYIVEARQKSVRAL